MGMNALGLGLSLFAQDAASGPIGAVGKGLDNLEKKASATGPSLREVSDGIRQTGQRMMLAGAAMLGGFGAAAFASSEFSAKIAEVATEADLAIFPQEKMAQLAKDMAERFGKMPIEQAEALYNAVAFGANDATKATDLMSAANTLAVAGVTDVKTAVDALAGTARAYNLDFSKTADISDAFFKAMTQGKMKVADLAHAMPKATGIAASLGISYDQLAGSIALLTSRGTQADEAVTGIKAALTNIIRPSSDASAEAARLGIKFDQAALRAKGWPNFLRDIVTNSKFTQESITKLFGSVEGANAVLQMVGGGMGDMDAMMKSMGERAGATAEGFAKMKEEPAFAFAQLKASAMVAFISIGDIVKPLLAQLIGFGSTIVRGFNNLPAPVKKVIVLFGVLAAVGLVVAGAALAVAGSLAAMAAAGEAAVVALAIAVGLTEYVAVAFIAGAVAVAVFREAINRNLGGIGAWWEAQTASMRLAFEALGQLFESGEFSGKVGEEMQKAENKGVRQFAIQVFMWGSRIKNFFAGISDAFSVGFAELGPVFADFVKAMGELSAAFAVAQDGPEAAAASFDEWGSRGQSVGRVLVSAVSGLVSVLTAVVRAVAWAKEGFSVLGSPLGNVAASASAAALALSPVSDAVGRLVSSFNGGTAASQAFGASFGTIAAAVVNAVAAAINVIGAFVAGAAGWVGGVITVVTGLVSVLVGVFTGDWARAWLGAKMVVFGVVTAIVSFVGVMVSAVAGALDGIAKMFGKDLGLQRGFEGTKAALLKELGVSMGVEGRGPAATTALPSPGNGPPGPNQTPPGAAPPPPGAPGATPVAGVAPPAVPVPGAGVAAPTPDVGAQVAAAITKLPPAVVESTTTVQLQVDGQVLADVVDRHSTASRQRGST